jgi:hypothetical protein
VNDDETFERWRREVELKREARADFLAAIDQHRERDQARSEALLDLLTRGAVLKQDDDNPDDPEETA